MKIKLFSFIAILITMMGWSVPASAQIFQCDIETPGDGQYYIYSPTHGVFLHDASTVTSLPSEAALFTIKHETHKVMGVTVDDGYSISYNGTKIDNRNWYFTIYGDNKYYYMYSSSTGLLVSDYVTYTGSGTALTFPYYSTAKNNKENSFWTFVSVTQFNQIYPKQVLANAGQSSATFTNWSTNITYDSSIENIFQSNKNSNTAGVWYAERYCKSLSKEGEFMEITLSGLTNGFYNLTMKGQAGNTNSRDNIQDGSSVDTNIADCYASISANDVEVPLTAKNALDCNDIQTVTLTGVQVTDGKMTISFNANRSNINWITGSIQSLTYQGTSPTAGTISVENNKLTANGYVTLANINAQLASHQAVYAADLRKAYGFKGAIASNNPNLLIYTNGKQVTNANNVVNCGVCNSLVFKDANTNNGEVVASVGTLNKFYAKSAKYTTTAVAGGILGTVILPFTASLPEGCSAYALTEDVNTNGISIWGKPVESLEANKPLLVTTAGTYSASKVVVSEISTSATHTNGNLTGVYYSGFAPIGSYVLQNHTENNDNEGVSGVAFYLVDAESNTKMRPFRCYIPQQTATSARAIKVLLDNEETAIDEIESENRAPRGIFDLSGRRVNKITKGIYIVNGKKVILN